MLNECKPFSIDFPALTAKQSQSLAFQCSDIVLNLSHDMVVVDVACSGSVPRSYIEGWDGRDFAALVSKDSKPKIDLLLNDNSALRETGGKWRHLNFLPNHAAELPLLIKFFRFPHKQTATNLICARDLRPLSDAQKQWQNQQNLMQQEYENRLSNLQDQLRIDRSLYDMIKMVGTQPLDNLVSNSLRYLERQCCIEALQRSNGELEEAANLLGVTVESFQMKLGKE